VTAQQTNNSSSNQPNARRNSKFNEPSDDSYWNELVLRERELSLNVSRERDQLLERLNEVSKVLKDKLPEEEFEKLNKDLELSDFDLSKKHQEETSEFKTEIDRLKRENENLAAQLEKWVNDTEQIQTMLMDKMVESENLVKSVEPDNDNVN